MATQCQKFHLCPLSALQVTNYVAYLTQILPGEAHYYILLTCDKIPDFISKKKKLVLVLFIDIEIFIDPC